MNVPDRTPHRGWAVLSTGAALLIVIIVVAWGGGIFSDYMKQREYQVTAGQLMRVKTALRSYIGRYYETLLTSATPTTPVIVTVSMLKSTGFLPAGFSETTSSGQTFQGAVVRHAVQTDQLQALMYTRGGVALPFAALRQIAMDIPDGGYVWNGATIIGAMGSWREPLATFGVTTTSGQVAAILSAGELGDAREESDRLYRFSVPGRPDLNRMHTAIDMGANDINNTGTVNAGSGKFSASVEANAVESQGDIRTHEGWLISRGSKGWISETYGGGFYMSDNDWVRVVNDKGIFTGGQMKGGSVRADGRLSTGEVLQLDRVNIANTACSQNGLISRDANGSILACESGMWRANGALQQNECIEIGNATGRDFTNYRCPLGWYSAGLRFTGHQRNESAYVITCCH